MQAINFIATSIIGNPGILFGLIALLGLLLLKKPFEEVLMGVVKTVIGFIILVAGCGLLLEACNPITAWVNQMLGVQGVIPQNWIIMSTATKEFGSQVGLVVLVGFVINLLLARFTKLKYVALTGQILVIWAAFAVGVIGGYEGASNTQIILFAGVFCGVYNWLAVAVSHHFMKKSGRLTDEWGLYVTEMTGIALTCWLAPKVGDPSKRCDELKVPVWMEWMRDTTVSISVIATVIWLILGIIVGKEGVAAVSGGENWIIYLLFLGLKFGAGLTVVLYGVRIMLAEIVPAFKGISSKIIPGAIPGLDYPTVFQFAPTAVFVGFLSNLAGGILATVVMVALKWDVIILPAVWMNFWTGAMLGVFADAYGGRRATVILNLLLGFLSPFGWALAYPLSGFFATTGGTADYTDSATIGLIYEWVVKLIFGK